MKILISAALLFFCSTGIFAQQAYQLAPPLMKFQSIFFSKPAVVELKFGLTGSRIRYTLDGQEPTESANLYTRPVTIRKSFTTMKAKVFSDGFLPSETVSANFIKDGIKVHHANFPVADKRFPGTGAETLTDNKGGLPGIGNPTWLGYQQDSVDVVLTLKKTSTISKVLVDLLEDHGSWVFLPEKIEVYYKDAGTGEHCAFGKMLIPADKINPVAHCEYRIIEANQPVITNKILIRLMVLKSMPEAHPGKGKKSWIFIDEIKVY